MKRLIFLAAIVWLASCTDESLVQQTNSNAESEIKFTTQEINDFIYGHTQKGHVFDWSFASLDMIHSASQHSDEIITLGYTLKDLPEMSEYIGTVDKLPESLLSKRAKVLDNILASEKQLTANPNLKLEDILPFELDDEIPTLAVKITSLETLEMLAQDDEIRYIEPMGYDPTDINEGNLQKDAGCNGSPNYGISGSDYNNTTSYNAKIPWNFGNHNIQNAWNQSQGDNISICIIDTGASFSQNNLGSQFTSGNSGGRFIQKYSTKYSGSWWWKTKDSANDDCGHGTSMAGLAAAPWGNDGNALGVAYKANLVTVRAVGDVLISSTNEKNGVKDALKLAGNRSDVKVVSMSIGNIISSGTVKDGVYYAYNRGKLLLAAAGTSTYFTGLFVGVIFPANMSQCTAVTGVKSQSSYQRCSTCHDGSKVEFTIEMQRSYDNDRTSLGLATTSDQPKYVGGSSCATATTAGIAALVWATNPSMSRTTVKNRLKKASELYFNKSNKFGYGNINAQAAINNQYY